MSLSAMWTSEWHTPQNFTSKVTSSSPPTFLLMSILWNLASLVDLARPNVVYMVGRWPGYFLRAVNTIDYIPTVGVNEYNCSLIT